VTQAEPNLPAASRRHPRWGIVAQVIGILGVALIVLMVAGTWLGRGWAERNVRDLVLNVDDAAFGAVSQVHELTTEFERQAILTTNDADTQAVFASGAELARSVEVQLADVQTQAGGVGDTLVSAVTVTALVTTAVLVYQVLLHGALWTLGRHWRRD
jgi:hypothetical protein